MGNSVVDLGAAALDYAEGVWDYMTGAPEASASGGYYKNLGPGARQYFSGPGDYKKTNPVMEYFGFEDGGSPAVELQDDGSLPGVDALRYMTPQEVEDGSYNFLQNMEEQMLGHLASAQSVHSEDIPVRQSLDMKRYHYEEAEKLRDQIEQFKERRASAIQNYPESETKLYMKEGESPYVKGFPDDLVQDYYNGGVVSLGAGEPAYIDMGNMDMNSMFATPAQPGDEYYVGEYPGRVYREGDYITEPGYLGPEYQSEVEGPERYDMYQSFPEGRERSDFGRSAPEIAMETGGAVPTAPEESGIASFMYDVVTGNAPSDQLNALRTSGRIGDEMSAAIYGDEPTFMDRLITDYNYPATIPMQDDEGFPVLNEQGGQKMAIATDFSLPEYMRTQRPRPDMPTYGELEDARAHALASAELARRYGPETAKTAGGIKELTEMLPGFGSSTYGDMKMDTRNNAFGIKLFREAGVNSSPRDIAKSVDREVFKQLDIILGRSPDRQSTPAKDQPLAQNYFKSPEGGLDVYFPRDKEGYFDTTYLYD